MYRVAEKYPLIRIPTQPARMRLVDVLALLIFLSGISVGLLVGLIRFGIIGAVVGAFAGGLLGIVVGSLPNYFIQEMMFRDMQRSSNEQLIAKVEKPNWSFYHTLALLNLQLRGESVESYLPRILDLMAVDDRMIRLFARDALRLVFTPLAKQLDDFGYDPDASTEDCRSKAAKLRMHLG